MHGSLGRLVRLPLMLLVVLALVVAACTGDGGTSPAPDSPAPESPPVVGESPAASPDEEPTGLLADVLEAGVIRMSTDPEYPPQSALAPDGSYEGFDIDVGTEIAERLGVEIQFETPSWDVITAGSWGGRWDFSVGSMTITTPRQEVLMFSDPYYFTPAQMAVPTDSAAQSLDDLAGATICVGATTTYQEWIEGTLDFGTESPQTTPPDGAQVTTLPTDRQCAESWRAGRTDFEAWLSSSTTVQGAIDAGLPVRAIGDPVFYEPLAVAFDRSGPDATDMVERVNQILADMRADGTLSELSNKWFDEDLTVRTDQ
jgi:polar amino acid transport system substrate-binding protein